MDDNQSNTVTITLPEEFVLMADIMGIEPKAILDTFVANLCNLKGNTGRSATNHAKTYLLHSAPPTEDLEGTISVIQSLGLAGNDEMRIQMLEIIRSQYAKPAHS